VNGNVIVACNQPRRRRRPLILYLDEARRQMGRSSVGGVQLPPASGRSSRSRLHGPRHRAPIDQPAARSLCIERVRSLSPSAEKNENSGAWGT